MDAIEALLTRTASPRLVAPAPTPDELQLVYKAALRAPDHGLLRPWRYLVISGDARAKLGELFVRSMKPDNEARKTKLRNAPSRAPLIIVAVTEFNEGTTIPAIEQVGSTAAGIQNMSIAIHALGYASIWRTGPVAFDAKVKQGLGLKESDEIVGYLYVGTATVSTRPVPEHDIANFFTEWE